MNASPLLLDVLDDDYLLLQNGGYGDHLEHDPADRLHQPEPEFDLDLGLDLGLGFDLNPSPSASSSSRSFPLPLGHSPSIFPPDSDSASDLQVTASASASASASDFDLASGLDLSSGPGLDLDSGQDTTDPAGAGSTGTGSSSSSPNPDPLVDRPRLHHLQSNDFNYNDDIGIGLDWHHSPPPRPARPATPARASLTPDIHHHHPIRHLHHRPQHHHHHRSRLHSHSHRHRHRDHHHQPGNRPSPPPPPANQHQPPRRFDPQPVSQRHLASRHQASQDNHHPLPLAEPSLRHGQSQRSRRQGHTQQHWGQATPVPFQNIQDQHQGHNQHEADLLLQQHLRLQRARRAARSAREAGPRRPGRGNWGPQAPAGRTAAEEEQDIGPGQEHLYQGDSSSMDQDDELIEVVFEGPAPGAAGPQRRQQRQARHLRQQQRRDHQHQNDNNQGQDLMEGDVDDNVDHQAADQHVPVIDLTEEPDSPDLQRHRPINILRHNSHNLGHNHRNNHIHIFDDDEDEEDEEGEGGGGGGGGGFAVHVLPPRHPRRHMAAQNGRMPSLNRSDGSILNGNAAAVIDLTLDSPDDIIPANRRLPPPPAAAAAAQLHNQPAHRNHHHRRLPAPGSASPAAGIPPGNRAQYQEFGRHLIGSIRGLLPNLLAQAVNNNNNPREAEVQIVGAIPVPPHPFGNMDPNAPNALNPLAGNPPEFNYQANGFGFPGGRQPTPKPDFQPPPPARPGFTRNTRPEGGDKDDDDEEEHVVVCPSCGCELKYDPDEEDDNPRPAKKARGKKSQEEHHFWAVKNCGHVFCKKCYENRKKHSKGKDSAAAKTGFRFQPSETSKSIKIFCAVDDCDSEVSPNSAWVGIFL
ncbi:hypothetical protein KVR01_013714 [Diaporthe batatas]|uniref:uncharacterized protein n=1 Tax=Diaporthe batatas TaxID=748121 RepID=UPI001D0502DC|nr:uncharacterized protein KVR01_013714 [Diaporthe batatas]KAG8156373.1 hypothetical protein KVR01_013714 [Diaporthe batatas]